MLDMLAAMKTAEELDILESLTEAQKRQIWAATPRDIKAKLWNLRQAAIAEASPPTIELASKPLESSPSVSYLPDPINTVGSQTPIGVGDRVVLKAKPDLTVAELKAIFEVVAIEAEQVRVKTVGVEPKAYPLDWLVLYAKHSN